jgi:hypothetical protein
MLEVPSFSKDHFFDNWKRNSAYESDQGFMDRVEKAREDFLQLQKFAAAVGAPDLLARLRSGKVLHAFAGYGACSLMLIQEGVAPSSMVTVDPEFWSAQLHKFHLGPFSPKFSIPAYQIPEENVYQLSVQSFLEQQRVLQVPQHVFTSVIGFDVEPHGLGNLIRAMIERHPSFEPSSVGAFTTVQKGENDPKSPLFEPGIVASFLPSPEEIHQRGFAFHYQKLDIPSLNPEWSRYGYLIKSLSSDGERPE